MVVVPIKRNCGLRCERSCHFFHVTSASTNVSKLRVKFNHSCTGGVLKVFVSISYCRFTTRRDLGSYYIEVLASSKAIHKIIAAQPNADAKDIPSQRRQ